MLFGLWAAPIAATVINVLTSGFTHGPVPAVFSAVRYAAHDSPRWPGGVNGFIRALRSGAPEQSGGPAPFSRNITCRPPIG